MQNPSHSSSRIIPCPNCRERFEELEEEIRQFKELVHPKAERFLAHIHLTGNERALLELLNLHQGRLISNNFILNYFNWNNIKHIQVVICRLRKLLDEQGFHIETVFGQGYILQEGEAPPFASSGIKWTLEELNLLRQAPSAKHAIKLLPHRSITSINYRASLIGHSFRKAYYANRQYCGPQAERVSDIKPERVDLQRP